MNNKIPPFHTFLSASTFFTAVPGPDRKRTVRPYLYRVTYFNDDPDGAGCALACEVSGGRMMYQVALERRGNGDLRWHCTCADHVYRAENEGRVCKHVRGLLALGRQTYPDATAKAT